MENLNLTQRLKNYCCSFLACLLFASVLNAQTISFSYTGLLQNYTVPAGVTSIVIETFGAQGKSAQVGQIGGLGARMKGTFAVTPGDQLLILIGGEGTWSGVGSGGGGGGTFVVKINPSSLDVITAGPYAGTKVTPLIISGGGGGTRAGAAANGNPGVLLNNGTTGSCSNVTGGGGINASTLGMGGAAPCVSWGSGGGGFRGNGANDANLGTGGFSFLNGGVGGAMNCSAGGIYGGFGGGGSGGGCWGGGGGGGYTGGDGGLIAGGGGSYNTGTSQNNASGVKLGNGFATITPANIAPMIIPQPDMTLNENPGLCGANVNYSVMATGVPIPTITYSIAPGSFFPVGTTMVIATATNTMGTDTDTFNITVIDNIAPIVLTQDIAAYLNTSGNVSISAVSVNNGSGDECGLDTLTLDNSAFNCSNIGPNTVTLTATDVHGNMSSNTATVTVVDSIAPTIVCEGDILATANSVDCMAIVTWNSPIVNDNCSYTVSSTHNSGSQFPIGTTIVTYTVTDASGNAAHCSFNVMVTPSALEASTVLKTYIGGYSISCHGNKDGEATVNVTGGCLPYTYHWNTVPVQTTATASNLGAGSYTVIVTDINGQSISLTVTLTEPAVLVANAGPNTTVYYGYSPKACTTLMGVVSGGTTAYTYSWSNGATTANTTVCPTSTTCYQLNVTDTNGCKAHDKVVVCVVNVRCAAGGNAIVKGTGNKVMICHKTGNSVRKTLCISASDVPSHLAHGDILGECGTDSSCNNPTVHSRIVANDSVIQFNNLNVYPNPFSNTTTLEFTATASEQTRVEIIDLTGAVIAVIYNGNTENGENYRFEVDSSNWNSNIYVARIVSNNNVQNVKLILTR